MKRSIAILICAALIMCLSVPALAADAPTSVRPSGICEAGDGSYIITDVFNKQVLKGNGTSWTVIAGKLAPAGASGEPNGLYIDGKADEAYFSLPWDVVPFMDGYAVSDAEANVVRYVAGGTVQTLITTKGGLNYPTGLATDGENLYVADSGNDRIVKMDKNGSLSVYASKISGPTGICWSDGALYVCETDKNRVLCVTEGKVSIVAGTAIADGDEYEGGYVNGSADAALFDHPMGVIAKDDVIYVSDTGNMAIRKISAGMVTTIIDASDVGYKAAEPRGLAFNGADLVIADVYYPYPVAMSTVQTNFVDVKADDPALPVMQKAAQYRIIQGWPDPKTGELRFMADTPVTRAQFVTMLSRAQLFIDGQTVISGANVYTDVKGTEWFANAINWATDAGYMLGKLRYGERVADPGSLLKPEEIDLFLDRFAAKLGVTNEHLETESPVTRLQAVDGLLKVLEKAGY